MNYSTNQICKLARVTPRQLQWWDEHNVVSPHHDGHRRSYTEAQAREIVLVAGLRRKGLSLQRIRKILRRLQRELMLREEPFYVAVQVDGRAFHVHESADAMLAHIVQGKRAVAVVRA